MRGQGGANTADRLISSHRFGMRAGADAVKIPAEWLSHGYQGAIAWLADVVGHVLWEASAAGLSVEIEPEDMEGLVLVDELDLHLHPRWQQEPQSGDIVPRPDATSSIIDARATIGG